MSGLADNNKQTETVLLLARLEVKDYFLQRAVRDIYDNTGQVLSLVTVNLTRIQITGNAETMEIIEETKQLVSQTIRDLRSMASLFNPENWLQTVDGFLSLTREQFELHFPGSKWEESTTVKTRGGVDPEKLIGIFSVILLLFENITKPNAITQESTSMHVYCSDKLVSIDCQYSDDHAREPSAALQARVHAMQGSIRQQSDAGGLQSVQLTIPLQH